MKVKQNYWPHTLIAFFVILIGLIAGFIAFALGQNMDLVRTDYYEAEILHQHQIDRVARTAAVRGEVSVHYDAQAGVITVQLPRAHAASGSMGTIQLYRPSNARLDHRIALDADAEGRQRIDAGKLASGFWKVQLLWTAGGEDFYFDQALVLGGRG